MQKKNSIARKVLRLILPAFAVGALIATAVPATSVSAEDALGANVPVFELSTSDSNPITTLKNAVIRERASVDSNINLEEIDFERSMIDVTGLDYSKTGIQSVKVKVNLIKKVADNATEQASVGYFFTEDAAINVSVDSAPKLSLKSSAVTVNNGDTFNPESYISYIADDSGNLPTIKIDSNVDMSVDGDYNVTYTAVDLTGNSTTATLNVTVKTHQEVLDAIAAQEAAAEEAAKAEAEAKAKEEDEKKAKEEEERRLLGLPTGMRIAGDGTDPYRGGAANCVDMAWILAYNNGHVLPNWGNAYNWIANAHNTGYATGYTPAVGSIAVYSNHVAYVAAVEGDRVYIQEGGFNGGYNERWVSSTGTGTQSLQGYIYLG